MSATNLLIRLSDEARWACEPFQAETADEFAAGCLEAFVSLRTEWPALCNAPQHQTGKHAAHAAQRPTTLLVQVCYHGDWCAQPFTPVVREPGSVAGAARPWADEDWADAWARCVRTFDHVNELGKFLRGVAR